MKKINDIFYSLQGEGYNTGRAAVFIRFAGCNLRCLFCDTAFETFREMSDEEIVATVAAFPSRFIVLTGGEPTLQVDESFVELLHSHGFKVAMESNGTRPAPLNLDWLTVSPKIPENIGIGKDELARQPDELKIIFDEDTDPETFLSSLRPSQSPLLYLQPCDTGDAGRNTLIINRCIDYIKEHPQWCLSLQTHKLVGFK